MQTIKLTYPHTLKANNVPETIAAIGFFDGIHKGHQAVIQQAVQLAKEQQKESAVITFHPHPSVVLNDPDKPVQYITPVGEKERLLSEMNVDRLYIITFNKQLSKLTPKQFVNHFIIDLHIKHVVAGFDFTFGHKGAGNMDNISQYTNREFTTSVIRKVECKEEKISSTRIRKYLHQGAVDNIKPLLGRVYTTKGTVIEGDKRGRKLGFPTANMQISNEKLLPKQGVYAVKVIYQNNTYNGMANLGVKPTFVSGELKPSVEVFIFDFDQDIYGEEIVVLWYQYIRDEKKFNGIAEIVAQLEKDEQTIRNYFR
ncbi:bifunctional riboflavin kinase/FAD synthetase [Pseudogracilibacillus auburnensis]|uniref:Riboflavin biosynthesis protein n=1 Tax=Pseudogracilibacillus auburnensis TaxID=1494959 RepID=A0A2V3W3I4_9BACI|nr:bifunctional riboflavin kinase/FAD synthetase [Pseudogracilibacillus auburnensis]MBO1003762.1 bifunctional riboflavin kinase/FAD synthetase [Pseudogracilibacillus auburnensis]PXW88652.1 FMN adenylyltransferase /riboflavin kinase [Pseudogracilibacillus auburnensis]